MLTPRRGAMVWPGTSSARDLGTISWRMNAVCEPLDHDSCRPSEDQWRKRNKDLGCLSQWERSKITSWVEEHPTQGEVIDRWKREDLSPEKSTILRSTSITGRRTTVESCIPTPDNVQYPRNSRTSTQECYPIVHRHQTYPRIPVVSTPEW